jgi:hypothetical protein
MVSCKECGITYQGDFCPNCETRTHDYWVRRFAGAKNSSGELAQHELIVARYVLKQPYFSDRVVAWAREVMKSPDGAQPDDGRVRERQPGDVRDQHEAAGHSLQDNRRRYAEAH